MHYVGSNGVNRIALIDLNRRSNAQGVAWLHLCLPKRFWHTPKCLPCGDTSQINVSYARRLRVRYDKCASTRDIQQNVSILNFVRNTWRPLIARARVPPDLEPRSLASDASRRSLLPALALFIGLKRSYEPKMPITSIQAPKKFPFDFEFCVYSANSSPRSEANNARR